MEVQWQDVRVGDVLKLTRNADVPADCIFLASHTADMDSPETCYVQTVQLDGESNLKLKQAVTKTVRVFTDDEAAVSWRGMAIAEAPNANFNRFVGTVHLSPGAAPRPSAPAEPTSPLEGASASAAADGMGTVARAVAGAGDENIANLEVGQLLLRGCQVRNVDYVYALVVYTGDDTKVRVKVSAKSSKRAQLEQAVNSIVITVVALLGVVAAIGAVGNAIWNASRGGGQTYLVIDSTTTFVEGLGQWATFLLLNASFVPVSLYVTMRLGRTLQMVMMEHDTEMCHAEVDSSTPGSVPVTRRYPFRVRSMELNDDLGQITHIFSDKTGTMTLNYMDFRKFAVGGVSYGVGTTTIGVARLQRLGFKQQATAAQALLERTQASHRPTLHVNFCDGSDSHAGRCLAEDAKQLPSEPWSGWGFVPPDAPAGAALHAFMLHLALNHTVLLEKVRGEDGAATGQRLSASSPDEEAFVLAAQHFGYSFVHRSQDGITLEMPPPGGLTVTGSGDSQPARQRHHFTLLHLLPYSQERKRMSAIVQHPDGSLVLYCKGADNVIYERLAAATSAGEKEQRRQTSGYMGAWGSDGLRTLCFAYKALQGDELSAWARRYAAACNDFAENMKRKNKQPNAIEDLMDEMERGLTLQGATANEDRLQPSVPETISTLGQAGIRVWMLTGDKQETAVNIGYATRLLDDGLEQLVATVASAGSAAAGAAMVRRRARELRASGLAPPLEGGEVDEGVGAPGDAVAGASASAGVPLHPAPEVAAVASPAGVAVFMPSTPEDRAPAASDAAPAIATVSGASPGSPPPSAAAPLERQELVGPRRRPRLDSRAVMFESDAEILNSMSKAGLVELGASIGIQDTTTTLPVRRRRRKAGGRPLALIVDDAVLDELLRDDGGATSLQGAAAGQKAGFQELQGEAGQSAASIRQRAATVVRAVDEFFYAARTAVEAQLPVNLRPKEKPAPVMGPARDLLDVAAASKAVVCCRCRPDQKAQMVKLVRDGVPRCRTLALGDGANDVDMIRTAHVGVGIAGAEGLHAANASDYSMARFHFLRKLLLVHGRLNYMRISTLVNYMFYKNVFFVMTQFWYSAVTGFSGQKFFVELGTQSYNLFFTGLPVMLLMLYDRDVDQDLIYRVPQLYKAGQGGQFLHKWVFFTWFVAALSESLAVYFVSQGAVGSRWTVFVLGTLCFTGVLLMVNLRIVAEMWLHHWTFHASVAGSMLLWVIAVFVFGAWRSDGVATEAYVAMFEAPSTWGVWVLLCGMMLVGILLWRGLVVFFSPTLRYLVLQAHHSVDGQVQDVVDALQRGELTDDPLECAIVRYVPGRSRAGSGDAEGAAPPHTAWASTIPHPTSVFFRQCGRVYSGLWTLSLNVVCCASLGYFCGTAPLCCKCAGEIARSGPWRPTQQAARTGSSSNPPNSAASPSTTPAASASLASSASQASFPRRTQTDKGPGGEVRRQMSSPDLRQLAQQHLSLPHSDYMSDESDSDASIGAQSTGGASTGRRTTPVRPSRRRRARSNKHGGGFTQDDGASEWLSTRFTVSGMPAPAAAAAFLRRPRGMEYSLRRSGGSFGSLPDSPPARALGASSDVAPDEAFALDYVGVADSASQGGGAAAS